jgi:hypothetical protein
MDQVLQGRLAAVSPVHEMVPIGPGRRPIAARKAAASIAYHKCTPDAGRYGSRRSPHCHGHTLLVHLNRRAHRIAPHPPGRLVDDRPRPLELGRRGSGLMTEGGGRNDDAQMGTLTARRG